MKVIIIDDEHAARQNIRDLLALYAPLAQVIAEAHDYNSAVKALQTQVADVVFLDINLGRRSGFAVLDEVGDINAAIIFVTAYDEYAVKAFRYAATDYLLKPIAPDELETTLARVAQAGARDGKAQLSLLKDMMHQMQPNRKKVIQVRNYAGVDVIKTDEILYITANGAYSNIVKTDGTEITASRVLKTFEENLGMDKNFLRVHKSYIANMDHVKTVSNTKVGTLTFNNNVSIPVTNFALVKERLEHL